VIVQQESIIPKERSTRKVATLLEQHEEALKAELGASAYDLLSPRQTSVILGVEPGRITDLTRQGWLEPAPVEKIGPAKLYYRWRVEFVRRYRKTYSKREKEK
jgi:hypothetical protein